MPQPDWTLVRGVPPFDGIEHDSTFDALKQAATFFRLPGNATLTHEGECPPFLHFVAEGEVELFGSHNGDSATFEVREAPVALLLDAVICSGPAPESIRTISPACIIRFSTDAVRNAFAHDVGFAWAVAAQIAEQRRRSVSALKAEKLLTGIDRLAYWISDMHQNQGATGYVDIRFNKRTLASQLGMTPENLSRNLALLAKRGIRTAGRRIYIENPRALEKPVSAHPREIDGTCRK